MTEAAIRRAGDPATASEGPVRSFKQLRVYEETRVWLEFAARCGYLSTDVGRELDDRYDKIASQLVLMLSRPAQWQAS